MSGVSNSFNQLCSANELASFRKAVASNNKESIEKHLSHMKSISEAELNAALFTCIQNFRIEDQSDECLFLLLRNKANPNCEINGRTPLIAACKIAQLTMVKHLVENGAKPDLCNSEGKHPLEFVLSSRKQNYDVAEYLIGVITSVNFEMGKNHVIVAAVEKEFARIFKMLVEKGALLSFNDESILHIIMKRKFKDSRKKKKFLKELANRPQLSLVRDKVGKLPIQYETDEEIKNYYHELFKPKVKAVQEKDMHQHSKVKEKEIPLKELSREKEQKKKGKEEEQSLAVEEEGVDEEENDQEGFAHGIINEQDKEKIVEVLEEEEEERKNQEDKEKLKKSFISSTKVLTPAALFNGKKNIKPPIKPFNQKSFIVQKPPAVEKVIQKQKAKKINPQKKKKQPQTSYKKSKSFTSTKRGEAEEQKKEEQVKKKPTRTLKQEEVLRRGTKKEMSQIKLDLQKQECKIEDEIVQGDSKDAQDVLDAEQYEEIVKLMNDILQVVQDFVARQTYSGSDYSSDEQSEDKEVVEVDIEANLTQEIRAYAIQQTQQHEKSQIAIKQVMNYLENKMKLCIESHIQYPFTFKIAVYGSQATALAVDQSDLDLLVITSLSAAELISMFEFYRIFEEEEIIDVKFIKSASMPVIKLVMGQFLHLLKVDLTFQLRGHTGLRCAELIEEFKSAQPLLRPLVVTLKRMIYAYKLADPYTGGLGSYSLTLMVIALLQFTEIEKNQSNLGRLLMEFLLFYGFQLDYVCQAIIIHLPGYNYKSFYSIYQLPNTLDLTPKLVIYDPLNPVNNVGRTTYRIECLKNLFRVGYLRIKAQNLAIGDLLTPQFMDLIQDAH